MYRYGDYNLISILTPGHTPGHLCLYDAEKSLLITGDHVLFDITPNINSRGIGTDALGDYLESLELVRKLKVNTVLSAHRTRREKSLDERITELLFHHERRLTEAEQIVGENPGINAYQIAGQMTWRIHARNWEEFPPGQKWFAMSEALAHLDYLDKRKRISRQIHPDGSITYV